MSDFSLDKLTESYTLRIPEITKVQLDKLPPPLKRKLNDEILMTMAKIIHESKFDPRLYLTTEDA